MEAKRYYCAFVRCGVWGSKPHPFFARAHARCFDLFCFLFVLICFHNVFPFLKVSVYAGFLGGSVWSNYKKCMELVDISIHFNYTYIILIGRRNFYGKKYNRANEI